jgi:methylase of polypeptide subunit release factors
MATPSEPLLDPTSPLLQQLRDLLLAAGYHQAGLGPTINEQEMNLPDAAAPATTLNTLIRVFFMLGDYPADEVAAAMQPLRVEQLVEAGLLRRDGDMLSTLLRIQPCGDLLFGFYHGNPDTPPEEALMLISPSSLEVAHLMTRRPARRALDIGTGSGFLATQLSGFCEQVHAIDVNPSAIRGAEFNARWNGISNITFLTGNLLEPVRGRQFDCIVSNPPFLIAPVTSAFSTRYRFKHSGLEGDTFSIDLARDAARLLAEDGYFHMIFQWEETAGGSWSSAPERAFANLGCDVWLARTTSLTAEEHVSEWLSTLSEAEQDDAGHLAAQARDYFARKKVTGTSVGLLTMHRVSGRRNYFWADEAPEDRLEPYGASVAALFALRAQLAETDDRALLQHKLRPAPSLILLQTSAVAEGDWKPNSSELSLTEGLKYSFGDVDPLVLKLIAQLNGKRTVSAALATLAERDAQTVDAVTKTCLPRIRELLHYGFLLPA